MDNREPSTQNTTVGQKSIVLKPTIPEPVAPEIEDEIILTISEVDRQTAGDYEDIYNCLICTALRNRGYNVWKVGPGWASLKDHHDWKLDSGSPDDLSARFSRAAPFYGLGVVGKVIRLRKVRT